MHKHIASMLSAFVCFLMFSHASAAETAVGEWAVVSDFNGQKGESTLTIEKTDDKLEGTIAAEIGEFELKDVTLKDGGVLEFTIVVDANGQEMALNFSGEINGDALEGNWTTDFGDFPAEAKRTSGGGAQSIVGTWDLMVDSQLGNNARTLVVNADMTGTYGGGTFDEFELSNIRVNGDTATMDVTLAVQGLELPASIRLKLDGDKVSGTLDYGQGEATITGKRAAAASIVGSWKIMADSQLGVNQRTLVINADMSGTYGGGDFPDFPVSNVKADGDVVTMDVTLSLQGFDLPSTIKLTLNGDEIDGTLDFGQGTATLSGTRQ